ncbi:unnamed protein product [Trichogramma brassicae]|uniref:Uncharacterized protein n=1 Tax=Trichogramma brassicae TaxID=86971 RepID=A0A6H5J3C2_9HYME|nr:unnamed protein product [Trichogramma brassicae]
MAHSNVLNHSLAEDYYLDSCGGARKTEGCVRLAACQQPRMTGCRARRGRRRSRSPTCPSWTERVPPLVAADASSHNGEGDYDENNRRSFALQGKGCQTPVSPRNSRPGPWRTSLSSWTDLYRTWQVS